jgi:hypothetical protein
MNFKRHFAVQEFCWNRGGALLGRSVRGGQIGRFNTVNMSVMVNLLAGAEEYRWRSSPINSLSLALRLFRSLSRALSLSDSQLLSRTHRRIQPKSLSTWYEIVWYETDTYGMNYIIRWYEIYHVI